MKEQLVPQRRHSQRGTPRAIGLGPARGRCSHQLEQAGGQYIGVERAVPTEDVAQRVRALVTGACVDQRVRVGRNRREPVLKRGQARQQGLQTLAHLRS